MGENQCLTRDPRTNIVTTKDCVANDEYQLWSHSICPPFHESKTVGTTTTCVKCEDGKVLTVNSTTGNAECKVCPSGTTTVVSAQIDALPRTKCV